MGLFLYPKEVCPMGYRKVGYLEQIWYILRYKFLEIKRKEDRSAKKTYAPLFLSRLPQADRRQIL